MCCARIEHPIRANDWMERAFVVSCDGLSKWRLVPINMSKLERDAFDSSDAFLISDF